MSAFQSRIATTVASVSRATAGRIRFKYHGPRKIMVKEDPKRESFAFMIGFTVGVLHAVMKHTFAALFKRPRGR